MRNPRHKRARRLQQPLALENQYVRELLQVATVAYRTVTRLALDTLNSHGAHRIILDADGIEPDPFKGRLLKSLYEVFPPELLEKVARAQATKVSAFHRQAITRQLTDAIGVGFWVGRRMDDEAANALLSKWIKTNVDLIESIPTQYMASIQNKIRAGIGRGLRVEDLAGEIEASGHIVASKASLIARDQTLKLYGGLNRERQKSVGIRRYAWRGVLDEAERPMHRDLEGQIFEWGDPPVTNEDGDTNDPGEDYQCRCDAEPVFE